nr:hypothetical protein [Tanacetum cinerariifolium]
MVIVIGWDKGLSVGRFDQEETMGFDAYVEIKLYLMYDKLFEKEYTFVTKVGKGYLHSVAEFRK